MTAPSSLPDFPVTTHSAPLPTVFDAPPQNPAPGGLYAEVSWTDVTGPSRHLNGVEIRGTSFPGASQTGIWDAPWCSVPALDGPRKEGQRGGVLDPFDPVVVWAFDSCDLTEPSRREVESRASQALRLRESAMVARQLADRLRLDAAELATIPTVDDAAVALAWLETQLAKANVVGLVHASPTMLPGLVSVRLVSRLGTKWITPGGHTLVVDGGYADGLGETLIATSAPLFGWRDQPQVRTAIDEKHNTFVAVAERTVLVGCEAVVASVVIES
ncbi:hypothetical protein [Mycobacterium sp. AT1]|uniref:hypothetical protein n=1 Tax=Mycobacterium sp. AT1 TaxID=1961706 RepID=UPI0009ACBDA6|nr:hypothetical protein [Mycobacterium sp. AT1]OPX12483.1 hypothetical protein B1790_03265 [Mycobacterium sp. AT1]